jgi:hydrogenase maturation protease
MFDGMRILVAGVGNLLRGDDGFGVRAAQTLRDDPRVPENVTVIEVGIGGIHLVQELMRGYDALVLFDAFDRGGKPGQLFFLEPELPELSHLSATQRRDYFSETHYAVPIRALTLAREVDALPPVVRIIGCQPTDTGSFGMPMHDAVAAAVGPAVELAIETVTTLLEQRRSR